MNDFPRLPSIIELHPTNRCTGDCVVCSKAHGGNNVPYMSMEVLDKTIERLVETGCETFNLQLGGDGDAFLHPMFAAMCRRLKLALPKSHRCLYTSAFSFTRQWADAIVGGDLLHEVQVRIDSLDPEVYHRSTGMFLWRVIDNLRYFAAINERAHLCIIYMPLHEYAAVCRERLGKEPTYAHRLDGLELRDEYRDVIDHFSRMESKRPIEVRKTGISLWAERTDCAYGDSPCPRLPENKPGDMARQLYVYPSGEMGLCGYDDAQCEFILGNVSDHSIAEVWNGPKMREYMDRVRNRTPENHPACCINPAACVMK